MKANPDDADFWNLGDEISGAESSDVTIPDFDLEKAVEEHLDLEQYACFPAPMEPSGLQDVVTAAESAEPLKAKDQLNFKTGGKNKKGKRVASNQKSQGKLKLHRFAVQAKLRLQSPKPEWVAAARHNFPLIDEGLIPTLLQVPQAALPDTSKRHGKANYTVHLEDGCRVQVLLSREAYYLVSSKAGSPLPQNRTISWAMHNGPTIAWAESRQRGGLPRVLP